MKKLVFLLSLLAVVLASCTKRTAEGLLETVPSDSRCVAVADMKEISKKLGSDGRNRVDSLVASLAGKGNETLWRYFFSENSAVDFSAPLALFEYHNAMLATFYVSDEHRFRSSLESATSSKFEKVGELYAGAGNRVFMKGSQAWFAPQYPEITPADIESLVRTPETQSMAYANYAAGLTDGHDDMAVLVNINRLFADMQNRKMQLVLNMILDDASYMFSRIDLDDDEVEIDTQFLNFQGQPSAFAIKPGKINVSDLKKFDSRGNVMVAVAASHELVHSIVRSMKNAGMAVPVPVQTLLEELNGNLVVAVDVQSRLEASLNAMLTFKDKGSAQKAAEFFNGYMTALFQDFKVYADGNRVYVDASATPEGPSLAGFAEDFKGAGAGIVLLPSAFDSIGAKSTADYIDNCVITVGEKKGGAYVSTEIDLRKGVNPVIALFSLFGNI